MNCFFQLERYQIESVAVAPNEKFNATSGSFTGDIYAAINIAPHAKDPKRYRLTLDVQVRPTPKKEKSFFPYHVAIRGRAFFLFRDVCSQAEADHALRLNGASILHGLLRAQIAQITAQSVHGQFLLPTMNFVELAGQQKLADKAAVK